MSTGQSHARRGRFRRAARTVRPDRRTRGIAPPVIDAGDLLDDPAGVVAEWCAAAGIPFIASALSWTAGLPGDMRWFEDGAWHGNLVRSTGFQRQPRDHVPIDHSHRLLRAHAACLPHDEALHAHRLTG
jgi:hypothetical protein